MPRILLAAYLALFTWAAIHPYDRATWWAENIPIVLIAATLVILYLRGFIFSATAYLLMSVLLFMHTIGGHYTFERVPFAFVTDLFGFHRNHYDRIAHFSVGFYAYAIAEALVRTKAVRSRVVLFLFPIFSIAFVAMGYELIEWIYADTAGGQSGAAFLGSQGDIWDAQKDMLADTLGAIVATILFFARGRHLAVLATVFLIVPAATAQPKPAIEWVFQKDSDLYAVCSDSPDARRLTADGHRKEFVTRSPDGSRVAFLVNPRGNALGTIVVVGAAGEKLHESAFRPEPRPAGGMQSIEQLDWLTPRRLVVSGSLDTSAAEYAILDAATGKEIASHLVSGFAWSASPGGDHVAYEYFRPAKFCVDDDCRPTGSGGHPKDDKRPLRFHWGPVWSSDALQVAIAATDMGRDDRKVVVIVKRIGGPYEEIPSPSEVRNYLFLSWDGPDLIASWEGLHWRLDVDRSEFVPLGKQQAHGGTTPPAKTGYLPVFFAGSFLQGAFALGLQAIVR